MTEERFIIYESVRFSRMIESFVGLDSTSRSSFFILFVFFFRLLHDAILDSIAWQTGARFLRPIVNAFEFVVAFVNLPRLCTCVCERLNSFTWAPSRIQCHWNLFDRFASYRDENFIRASFVNRVSIFIRTIFIRNFYLQKKTNAATITN